jgi:hypothetical protein
MPEDRRSAFFRAALAGSAVALVVDVLMLSGWHVDLWRQMGLLGSFYDAQGRALLHGHLNIPPAAASIEGFVVGGKTYIYFGPVPALLRIPVLLFTHSMDGRMTQLSMLLALVVLLIAGSWLAWRLREILRPEAQVGGGERAATFALSLALGTGVPLFLVSWPVIYHEAELWGAALSIAALEGICRVIMRPTAGRVAWAALLAVLAVNTRVAVGVGPIVALGLLALTTVAGWLASQPKWAEGRLGAFATTVGSLGSREGQSRGRLVVGLTLAAVVALGSAVALNEAKFNSAFSLPLSKQVDTQVDPNQRAYVMANHGQLLGPQFVPTDLLAAVRPDALGGVRAFPFIGLPDAPPTVIGDVRFNALLPTLSAFTSMPLLCLLLLAGLPALVRRGLGAAPVWLLLVATAVAFVPALAFGSTATRYLADLLPFLWVGACAGLQGLLGDRWVRERLGRTAVRVGALVAVWVLALAGLVINGSVGLVQQQLLAPTTTPAQRASFISTQDDIDRFLGRKPHGIHHGGVLPSRPVGATGDLFVLGRCDGLYVQGFGGTWLPVERGDRSGLHRLSVRFGGAAAGGPAQALLTLGRGGRRVTVVIRRLGPGRARFSIQVGGRTVATGSPLTVMPRRTERLTASFDKINAAWFLSVTVPGGRTAVVAAVPYDRDAPVFLGADPSNPQLARFGGTITRLPSRLPVCEKIARRAGIV